MESELLKTTLLGPQPGGRPTGARTRAKAPIERKPGKVHAFKLLTASVSPLFNTGRHVLSEHGNPSSKWARPDLPECQFSPAMSLPHDQPYNRSAASAVPPLHSSGQKAEVRTFSVASLAHDPALKGDDITAVSRLHNSRPTAAVQQQPSNSRPNAVGVNSGAAR
jgi:hypothetical protein